MNLDLAIERIEEGFSNPDTVIRRTALPDKDFNSYNQHQKLGRRRKTGDFHIVWMIQVGEMGMTPTMVFMDYKLKGILKKALAWKDKVSPKAEQPAT